MTNYEFTKALKINSSILFNLFFPSNIILSYFIFFFLIIDLYYYILAVIAQIFNPIAELIISIGIETNDANAVIETQHVTNFLSHHFFLI